MLINTKISEGINMDESNLLNGLLNQLIAEIEINSGLNQCLVVEPILSITDESNDFIQQRSEFLKNNNKIINIVDSTITCALI